MNPTARLQQLFQDFIVDGAAAISPMVVDGPRAGAERRLAIYANAYRVRLTEVLDCDYPALHALVGDELFKQLAHAYIAAYPSTRPSARWFGRHLPSFLMNDERFSVNSAWIEMASFEWAMSLAFDAADDPVLSLAQLAQMPAEDWPQMRLGGHPSLQRLELASNVPTFWRAVERGDETPQMTVIGQVSSWIVWRCELTVFYRLLEEDEAEALDSMFAGQSFAELCEGLEQRHALEVVPSRAVELLKCWVTEGLLVEHSARS